MVMRNARVLIDVLTSAATDMPWPEKEIDSRLCDWALQCVPADISIAIVPAPPPDLSVVFADTRYLVARRAFGATPFTAQDRQLLVALATMATTSRHHARREARLRRQAVTDDLTGLWSHAFFRELFERASVERDHDEQLAVLFLDLDRFKQINENLGHLDADDVLREVGARLAGGLPEGAILARMGGDEFAAVVRGVRGPDHVETIMKNVRSAVSAPMSVRDRMITVDVSVGSALSRFETDDPDLLLREAEHEMRRTKRSRPDARPPRWYDERTVLSELLDQRQIEVAFQPIVDLSTHEVHGYEALVRASHDQVGPVSPLLLVGSATRLRLLDELTELVVEQSIATVGEVAARTGKEIALSVNIEFEQLRQASRLLESLPGRLEGTGVRLVLEVSERHVARWTGAQDLAAHELKAAGIGLAVDDFGAGYSTFALLNSWTWSWIKIDQALVSGRDDDQGRKLLGHVATMLGDLDVTSVAEGVETAEQLAHVLSLGVHLAQGLYLGPPVASEVLLATVAEHGLSIPRLPL